MAAADTIKQAILVAFPNLNISTGSIWNSIITAVAAAVDSVWLECARVLRMMSQTLSEQKYTTERDYVNKLVQWQEGDIYGYIDENRYIRGYQTINPSIQNCKQAFIDKNNQIIYVCSADADSMLIPMTTAQMTDISAYFENFRIAGFAYALSTAEPATLEASKLTIRFRKEYAQSAIKTAVLDRAKLFQVTPHFTTEVLINTIESFLKDTEGVVDAYLSSPRVNYIGRIYNFVDGATVVPTTAINFWADLYSDTSTTLELIPV